MHTSSLTRMKWFEENYHNYFTKDNSDTINVLDVGSYNVNGTYRKIFDHSPYKYTGLDLEAGPNVDYVPESPYDWSGLEDDSYDVVISGQAFEHIEYVWLTIKEMARVTKPGGIVCVIAPNSSPEHKYPLDCYRFFSDGMKALAKYAGLNTINVTVSGIPSQYVGSEWDSEHNDVMLISQKNGGSEIINPPKLFLERRVSESDYLQSFRQPYIDIINRQIACFDFKKYFAENNISRISIYGLGQSGKMLYNKIAQIVDVVNIFDQNKDIIFNNINIDDLTKINTVDTDIVIITLPDTIARDIILKINALSAVKCILLQDILFPGEKDEKDE